MPLAKTFDQYARFTVLMTPVIIPVFAVLSSTFNKNIHGIVFVFLLAAVCLLVSFIGGWGAPPSAAAGPACYIFGGGGLGGWMGQAGHNSPDWHALILSFSLAYLTSGMFWAGDPHISLIFLLVLWMFLDAFIRGRAPLQCVNAADVIWGWVVGAATGMAGYLAMHMIEGMYDPPLSITYFSPSVNLEKCGLDGVKFTCTGDGS